MNTNENITGEIMIGKCIYCLKLKNLNRKYFHFNIKCECHSPSHFEIVEHCMSCTPKCPSYTSVILKEDFVNTHYIENTVDHTRTYFNEFKEDTNRTRSVLSGEIRLCIPTKYIMEDGIHVIKEITEE